MNRSSCCSLLVFTSLNWIASNQSNLCMASDKDKEKKRKAQEKLQETAAKKKKEEEEAQVASSFLAPLPAPLVSGASDDDRDSDRESGPNTGVDPGSPEPSTGQHELPATEEVVTPSKESALPEHLRFDVLEPSPKANNAAKLHHERAKAAHLEAELLKLHSQLHGQQQQVTPTEAATAVKHAATVHSPLHQAPGGGTVRQPVRHTKTGPSVDVSQLPWKDIFGLG
eukprot:3411614-Rhodomonas_salina.1